MCQSFHGHPGHAYPVQFTNKLITFSYARSPGGRNVLNRAGSGCLPGWCSPRQQQHGRHDAVSSHPVSQSGYDIYMYIIYILHFQPGSTPFFSFLFSFLIRFYSLFHPGSLSLFNQILLPFSSRFYFPFQSDSTPLFIQVLFHFSSRFYFPFQSGSTPLFI